MPGAAGIASNVVGASRSRAAQILASYDGLQAGQEAIYKDLHQHPELSHQEHRTAQRVAEGLHEYGYTAGWHRRHRSGGRPRR